MNNHKQQSAQLLAGRHNSVNSEERANAGLFGNFDQPVNTESGIDYTSCHCRLPFSDEGHNNPDVIGKLLVYPDKFVDLFELVETNIVYRDTQLSFGESLNFDRLYPFTEVNFTFQNPECPQPPQGLNIPNPVSNL